MFSPKDDSGRWVAATNVEQGVPDSARNNSYNLPALTDSSNPLPKTDGKPAWFNEVVTIICVCLVCLASGVSLGYDTPALTTLNHASSLLKITENEGSWMASAVMLGGMIGGVLSGFCISLGRKRTLLFGAFPLFASWFLIYFAKSVWYLYGSHFIMGICMGVVTDASQICVSEMASKTRRGALGCIPVLMFNIGMLFSYVAGAYLPWDNLAIFGAITTAPALFLPIFLPESPVFLMAKGETKQARSALQRLRGKNYNVNEELQELERCYTARQDKNTSVLCFPGGIRSLRWCDIRGFVIPFLHTVSIRALSRFCGLRAIVCYMQIIFNSSGSNIDSHVSTIITGVVQLVANLLACSLLDRLGRRKLLISSQLIMAVSLLGLGFYLYINDEQLDRTIYLDWIPLVTVLIYIMANSLGLSPVSGIVIGEIVPQRYRGIVSSTTGAFSWLSGFVITKTFYDLRSCLYLHGAMWAYAVVCIVGVFYVYLSFPETRGLSQIEIQTLFDKTTESTREELETKKDVPDVIIR